MFKSWFVLTSFVVYPKKLIKYFYELFFHLKKVCLSRRVVSLNSLILIIFSSRWTSALAEESRVSCHRKKRCFLKEFANEFSSCPLLLLFHFESFLAWRKFPGICYMLDADVQSKMFSRLLTPHITSTFTRNYCFVSKNENCF